MTPRQEHSFIEGDLCSQFDLARSLEQIDRSNDDRKLWNGDATSNRVVENANVAVASALGRDMADEKLRNTVEIDFDHLTTPSLPYVGYPTIKIRAAVIFLDHISSHPRLNRFRAAPCLTAAQSAGFSA